MSKRGIPLYARKPTLEERLTENLRDLREGKTTEVLPITEGYLAFLEGDEALERYITRKKPKKDEEK